MKAYLFQTGTTIEPFGDPVAEAHLGGEPMQQAVHRAFAEAGVTLERISSSSQLPPRGGCLLLPDTLFLTRRCIRSHLAASAGSKAPTRLALTRGPATDYARPLQEVEELEGAVGFDLYWMGEIAPPGSLTWPELKSYLAERAEPAVQKPDPRVETRAQSRPGPPREITLLPRTTLMAADVRHWVHILWLNHQLPWVRLKEHWEDRPGISRWRRSRGRNPYRKATRLSVIGKRCDIHPTATVEGSILGDRVRLGPFVSIRDSILGDGVEVGDHTKFFRCVVGEGCHTLNDSYFIGCTFYPNSTLASFMIRNSVLGHRVFLTSGVMLWDEAIDQPVSVKAQGRLVPTGRWILGGCAGHECLLGARAIFLPGRAIPNRTMIVMRPEEGVAKMPPTVSQLEPHVYHQGCVLPLEQVLPDWLPLEID